MKEYIIYKTKGIRIHIKKSLLIVMNNTDHNIIFKRIKSKKLEVILNYIYRLLMTL